jgi:hypothetical protein
MTTPVRLQLSRRKGYTLQAATIEANGLPAVNVARPGPWGNPYRVGPAMPAAEAVEAFREMWSLMLKGRPDHARRQLDTLRGKNLACWCKPGEPCHADVLLELATPLCEEVR